MPKSQSKPAPKIIVRRGGVTGIAIGLLALLVCELPIVFALIGLGGLSASALKFRPPPLVELGAIILFITGTAILLAPQIKRLLNRKKKR